MNTFAVHRSSIVHVMGWHSQQYGSFERFLVALSRRCADQGAQTHLVFPNVPPSAAFRRDVAARLHEVPLARHPADPRAVLGLRRLLDDVGATHVHAHFGLDAYVGMAVARAAGVPRRFATKHAIPGTARMTLSRGRHRWLARQVEVLFAVSHRVRDALIALDIPPQRIEVAYVGVDAQAYRPDRQRRATLRAELGMGDRDRLVICTSHLRPGKGVEVLPRLAATLRRDLPEGLPVRLLVAGDGPLRPTLEAEARALGLGPDTFALLGVREDVPELLAAADVYVLPTTGHEGMGLAALEALAAGVPVVVTAVSDLAALINAETGRVVAPGDQPALAGACRELLLDPIAARLLGARGRALVLGALDVGVAVEQHAGWYFRP